MRRFLFLALALLSVLACESEVREANIEQDQYIADYIAKHYADYPVYYNNGTSRVVLTEGPAGTPVIEKGDSVYLYYAGFLFSKNGPGTRFVLDSGMVCVGTGDLIRGLDNGLSGARLGEEAMILFSADDGYGAQALGLVPENSALLFNVGVGSIKKKQ